MSDAVSVFCEAAVETADRDSILEKIADVATRSNVLSKIKPETLTEKLKDREKVVSTAIGHGVAIPHCFVDGIDSFVVGVLTTTQEIDFSAPDGLPVSLFFYIVGPSDRRNDHVRMLSEISRAARDTETRERLRSTVDNEALERHVSSLLSLEEHPESVERCLLHVFIQADELFEPILEELSAHVSGTLAVQELRSAGSYLHRMPLFSAMWSEQVEESVRLLIAVVDKRLLNETARRIHEIADSADARDGVLIAAHDLVYSAGSISF